MFDDLAGTVIVVTGGGSGIGRATCTQLAQTNATVVVADLNLEQANETKSLLKDASRHVALKLDVSSSASVQELVTYIEQHLGQCPAGLVNSAGIVPAGRKSCLDCTEESWNKIIDVNLKGTFLMDTAIAKLMKKNGKAGSIVNIASLARNGHAPNVEYSASKAGVIGITKSLAQELGSCNIRVNAVAPGAIETQMVAAVPDTIRQAICSSNPLGRFGQADEIASACLFLLSQKASSYITGEVINVTGGEVMQNIIKFINP